MEGVTFIVPGTAYAVSFFGLALLDITPTRLAKVRILGTMRGKASLEPLEFDGSDETVKAACNGGVNSDSSISPFQGFTEIKLERPSDASL